MNTKPLLIVLLLGPSPSHAPTGFGHQKSFSQNPENILSPCKACIPFPNHEPRARSKRIHRKHLVL